MRLYPHGRSGISSLPRRKIISWCISEYADDMDCPVNARMPRRDLQHLECLDRSFEQEIVPIGLELSDRRASSVEMFEPSIVPPDGESRATGFRNSCTTVLVACSIVIRHLHLSTVGAARVSAALGGTPCDQASRA